MAGPVIVFRRHHTPEIRAAKAARIAEDRAYRQTFLDAAEAERLAKVNADQPPPDTSPPDAASQPPPAVHQGHRNNHRR